MRFGSYHTVVCSIVDTCSLLVVFACAGALVGNVSFVSVNLDKQPRIQRHYRVWHLSFWYATIPILTTPADCRLHTLALCTDLGNHRLCTFRNKCYSLQETSVSVFQVKEIAVSCNGRKVCNLTRVHIYQEIFSNVETQTVVTAGCSNRLYFMA